MESLFHEEIARGTGAMKKLWGSTVIVCGAGALGGNLLENLAKSGLGTLIVIDDDRIEKRNISTQPYGEREIGMQKVKALGNRIYKDIANNIQMHAIRLTQDNVCKLIETKCLVPRVVVDTFDNSVSRQIVAKHCGAYHIPCLHAGMVDGYSEVVWNEEYTLPRSQRRRLRLSPGAQSGRCNRSVCRRGGDPLLPRRHQTVGFLHPRRPQNREGLEDGKTTKTHHPNTHRNAFPGRWYLHEGIPGFVRKLLFFL